MPSRGLLVPSGGQPLQLHDQSPCPVASSLGDPWGLHTYQLRGTKVLQKYVLPLCSAKNATRQRKYQGTTFVDRSRLKRSSLGWIPEQSHSKSRTGEPAYPQRRTRWLHHSMSPPEVLRTSENMNKCLVNWWFQKSFFSELSWYWINNNFV